MSQKLGFLTLACLVIISVMRAEGQRPRKCAEFNEYCRMHSDCCSNSCMTYLYRCTRNYNQMQQPNFYGESPPLEGTLQDVINLTIGTSGSATELAKRKKQTTTQKPLLIDIRRGVVPTTTENYKTKINKDVIPLSNEIPRNTIRTKSSQIFKRDAAEAEAASAAAESQASEVAADCKSVGAKCFTNDECCTKRCHGFLHQCVT